MPENYSGLGDRTSSFQNIAEDKEYFQRPQCVERWLRNKAPLTRNRYPKYLNRLQLQTGLTPDQFLRWSKAVEPVEAQDLIDRTSLEFKPAIQFCYRVALRSFLHHNGYGLPKASLQYVSQAWHRGYKREEIERLVGQLRKKLHRLFVLMAAESGLRSHVIMALRYQHVMEDIESQTIPVAIRLEPRFHVGKKAAGYSFLGPGSVGLLKECIEEGLVEAGPDAKLIPRSYYGVWAAIHRASRKVGLDPEIQTCHGFRKYFENALDDANIDHEKKMIIEGHFAGTRARHYTGRDIEQLREVYRKSYSFFELGPPTDTTEKFGEAQWRHRLEQIETQIDRQKILEARLLVLQDELNKLTQVVKNSERN